MQSSLVLSTIGALRTRDLTYRDAQLLAFSWLDNSPVCYHPVRKRLERTDDRGHARREAKAVNLTAYLKANRAEHEFIEKTTTHHASDASRASGIPLDHIAKTIVFQGDSGALAVGVVLGTQMVSRHKLESCSGLHKLQTATDSVAENATGFPTGGIPPVGHRKRLKVYVDGRVAALDQVWCGGGTRTRLVRLHVADIIRLAAAEVCDIATPES